MKEETMTFKVVNDEGREVECEVLFTFESDETKKNYIVYTDNTIDEEGKKRKSTQVIVEKLTFLTSATSNKEENKDKKKKNN